MTSSHSKLIFSKLPKSNVGSFGQRNELIGSYRDTVPSKIDFKNSIVSNDKNCPQYFDISRGPIDFDLRTARLIQAYVKRNLDKRPCDIEIFDSSLEPIIFEVRRFTLSLIAYYKANEVRNPIEKRVLLDGILDKNFAKKLKAFRNQCFLSTVSGVILEPSIEEMILPVRSIYDIGEIFNYNYWIFWKEDDPIDYLMGHHPEKKISDEDLSKFRKALYDCLPEHIPSVLEEEILLSNSSSTCILEGDPLSKSKVFKSKTTENKFSNKPLNGKRSVIRVGPDNTRDSILLSVPQSNTVKLFEKQLSLICQTMKGSTHLRDPIEFKKTLDEFYDKFYFFYDRDIEKEGITKPRQLIQEVLTVLEDKYPNFSCWNYKDIFSKYYVTDNNQTHCMQRGHGLGMGNSLTTIMQAGINSFIINEFALDDESLESEIGFLTYNDDYTAGFLSETDQESYILKDLEVCERLQILVKKKKTHKIKSKAFVFCEHYYPPYMNRKESYLLTELYNAFAFGNILDAKEYYQMIQNHICESESISFLEELINRYGYEFYDQEWLEPYIFGGWSSPVLHDVRLDLYNLELTHEKKEAYMAIKEPFKLRLKKKVNDKKIYNSPLIQKFGTNLEFPDCIKSMLGYNESEYDSDLKHILFKNDFLYNKYTEKRFSYRSNLYKKYRGCSITKKDIFIDLLKRYPFVDFLPPRSDIIEEEINEVNLSEKSQINLPNPLLSMIKFFNPQKVSQNVVPNITQFIGLDNFKYRNLDKNNKFLNGIFPSISVVNTPPMGLLMLIGITRSESDKYNIVPDRVVSAYYTLTGLKRYPLTKYNFERELFINPQEQRISELLRSDRANEFLLYVETFGFELMSKVLDDFDLLPKVYIKREEIIPKRESTPSRYNVRDFQKWISDDMPVSDEYPISYLFQEAYGMNKGRLSQNIYIRSWAESEKFPSPVEFPRDYRFIFELNNWISSWTRKVELYEIFFEQDSESSDEEDYSIFD